MGSARPIGDFEPITYSFKSQACRGTLHSIENAADSGRDTVRLEPVGQPRKSVEGRRLGHWADLGAVATGGMNRLPPLHPLSNSSYLTLVLKLTAALGAYGVVTFLFGGALSLATIFTLGLWMLGWLGVGFVLVPYLSFRLLTLGVARTPKVAAVSLLVPLVGMLVTPVGSNREAIGVLVPWLAMHRSMSEGDMAFAKAQAIVTIASVVGGVACGLIARRRAHAKNDAIP